MGKFDEARLLLQESWEILIDIKQYHIYLIGVGTSALFFAKTGIKGRAIEIYTQIFDHPMIAGSAWYERIVGNHIKSITKDLSQKEVNDATVEVRKYHLWELPAKLLVWLQ